MILEKQGSLGKKCTRSLTCGTKRLSASLFSWTLGNCISLKLRLQRSRLPAMDIPSSGRNLWAVKMKLLILDFLFEP